jgi:hypothetical protein
VVHTSLSIYIAELAIRIINKMGTHRCIDLFVSGTTPIGCDLERNNIRRFVSPTIWILLPPGNPCKDGNQLFGHIRYQWQHCRIGNVATLLEPLDQSSGSSSSVSTVVIKTCGIYHLLSPPPPPSEFKDFLPGMFVFNLYLLRAKTSTTLAPQGIHLPSRLLYLLNPQLYQRL